MTAIKVIDRTSTEVTRYRDPNDKWDADDTATSHDIRGIEVVGPKGYNTFEVPFKVERSKAYYLLYVIYSTGDSFHHEEGCIEFVDLYQTVEQADENAKRIEKHYKGTRDGDPGDSGRYSVSLVRDDGTKLDTHTPWIGYFERLTSVEVEKVEVLRSREID